MIAEVTSPNDYDGSGDIDATIRVKIIALDFLNA